MTPVVSVGRLPLQRLRRTQSEIHFWAHYNCWGYNAAVVDWRSQQDLLRCPKSARKMTWIALT